jgi:hypothetical protein
MVISARKEIGAGMDRFQISKKKAILRQREGSPLA